VGCWVMIEIQVVGRLVIIPGREVVFKRGRNSRSPSWWAMEVSVSSGRRSPGTPWTSCSQPNAITLRPRRFFERAIGLHDVPEKITIDKSGANTAAVHSMIADSGVEIELRQSKYLNNLIEQDHRAPSSAEHGP